MQSGWDKALDIVEKEGRTKLGRWGMLKLRYKLWRLRRHITFIEIN